MRSIISSNLLVISFGVQTIGFMRIKVNWTIFEVPEKTNRTVGYIKAKKWVSFKLNGGVWVCTLATVCTNSTGSWKGSDVLKPFQLPYADKVGKTIKRCIVQLSFARLFPQNVGAIVCEYISVFMWIDFNWLLTAYQRFRPNGKQEVLTNSNHTNFPVNTFSSLFHVESYCDGSIWIVTKPTTNSINFHNFVFVKMFHEFSNCFAVDYVTISIANGKFSGWFETVTTDLFWYSISLFRQRNSQWNGRHKQRSFFSV